MNIMDTNIVDPGSILVGEKHLGDLLAGDHLKAESENQILDVYYDSVTGMLKATGTEKPDTLPGKYKKTTETEEYSNTNTSEEEESTTVNEKQIAERGEATSESSDNEVKRTYWPFWVG